MSGGYFGRTDQQLSGMSKLKTGKVMPGTKPVGLYVGIRVMFDLS